MALAQSEFARSTVNDPKPGHGPSRRVKLGARLRLALGVAAILALAVVGAIGDKPASSKPEGATDDNGAVSAIESGRAPAFDGRGKWSGYAR